jgi:hypothetical protein
MKNKIPIYDPQTGEPNPHYEELTGKKNSLSSYCKKKDSRPKIRPEYLKDIDKMPNQKWHKIISFIKSGIRIVGYVLIPFDLVVAASVLVISEFIGIVEELV